MEPLLQRPLFAMGKKYTAKNRKTATPNPSRPQGFSARPEFDAGGYPTAKTLKTLKCWPFSGDSGAALDFIADAWSGNESLIDAFRKNLRHMMTLAANRPWRPTHLQVPR